MHRFVRLYATLGESLTPATPLQTPLIFAFGGYYIIKPLARVFARRRVAPHLSCDRRAHPLARDEGQAGYRLGRGRLKCRAWAYTTPARSGFFPSFCAPPLNKPHSFRPVVREASKDRMIRRRGRTETATRSCACAKLSLGLGFHGCAHLSRVDNKVLFSRPCLGGYRWLRTKQLLRWRPMEGLTRISAGRSPPSQTDASAVHFVRAHSPETKNRLATGSTRQMVLPTCRCPSASRSSRVLPACRPAGHSKCRACTSDERVLLINEGHSSHKKGQGIS